MDCVSETDSEEVVEDGRCMFSVALDSVCVVSGINLLQPMKEKSRPIVQRKPNILRITNDPFSKRIIIIIS